ncbi:hypothetical protein CEP83_08885 [Moraxella catarrhalis]|uniref:hypothetical protein n=1 Tax=Moraxella catarrhalis TaxID=480 RepID=UPI000CFE9668|nr:hypothetical protein [Moraxella catarrhalis]AVL51079.1 hypothetical protein CEP83_08885 [Moraxella catarrhalis]
MSFLKKKKTFTNTDSASLYAPSQVSDAKQVKKQAIKQWVFEGSQRPLHEYLLASSQNGLKSRWDKLYELVQTKNIYSEYRWDFGEYSAIGKPLKQLNWKKAAEEYLKEKFPNPIDKFLHIDHGDLWELPSVDARARKRFRFRQVNKIDHNHEVLIQSNPRYVVVLVGNDYNLQSWYLGSSSYVNKPNYHYLHPKNRLSRAHNYSRAYRTKLETNPREIRELASYPRVKPLSRESYTFVKFLKEDYDKIMREEVAGKDTMPIAELIGIDAKSLLPNISTNYVPTPYPDDERDTKPYEWFGAEYIDKQGNVQTYYEHIPDLRNHRIGALASKHTTTIPISQYHPIPIRISDYDMDKDSELLTGNSLLGKLFLNRQRRTEQLKQSHERIAYDRTYAAEALAVLGYDIKELISSFRDSMGADWGKLDDVWIHLSVPLPYDKSDFDVPVLHKYWHLYNYMMFKFRIATYFNPDYQAYYRQFTYMYSLPTEYGGIDDTVFWRQQGNPFTFQSHRFKVMTYNREHIDDFRSNFIRHNSPVNEYELENSTERMAQRINTSNGSTFDIPNELLDIRINHQTNGSYTRPDNYWFVPYNLYPYNRIPKTTRTPIGKNSTLMASTLYGSRVVGFTTLAYHNLPVIPYLLKQLTRHEQDELLQYAMQLHTRTEETVKVYRDWVKPAVKLGLVSPKLAGYLQLIITVVMAAHGASWDFSKLITAPNIMTAVNQSFNAYNKQKAYELAEVYKQIQDETVKYQTKTEALKTKQKMLDLGVAKDAKLYLNMPSYAPKVNLFETPQMMYARHSNINVVNLSLGTVSNLADGLLSKQQTPNLTTVADIQQQVEDVLLIT